MPPWTRAVALIVALAVPTGAAAATCPPASTPVPVVSLAPHQVAGFSWGSPIRPLGDACVTAIAIDPGDAARWYVGAQSGLYVTADGGQKFSKPVSGPVVQSAIAILPASPSSPQLVYVGAGTRLFLSKDRGATFAPVRAFTRPVYAVAIAPDRTVYVGLADDRSPDPSGVYRLKDGVWSFLPFGAGHTGLIVWTIARAPATGTLYAGTEIPNHNQPGSDHPPVFRSMNDGASWTNIRGTLPATQVLVAAVRPGDGYVYALTEGAGVYGSATHGDVWIGPLLIAGPTVALLMDPKLPKRLFGGQQKYKQLNGGAFVSVNSGRTFHPIGLAGVAVSGLGLDGASARLFVAAYASGVYMSPVPPTLQPD